MNFFQSRKSLILSIVSALFALFLIFIMAGSNRLKDYLNDRMSDSITSRPYQEMQSILPAWFNYLLNTAFWIEAGDFPESFDNANLNLLDKAVLETLPGAAAVNYRLGEKWISFLKEEGQVILREIPASEELRRIPLKRKNPTVNPEIPSEEIFLTEIHTLPSTGEPGFSISVEIPSSRGISVSLDISLSRFIEYYKDIFSEEAILFSSFSSSDYITIPLDSGALGEWTGSPGENDFEDYSYYNELTRSVIGLVPPSEPDRPALIEYDEKKWFVLIYELNDYGSSIGFILPESNLFFSQFDRFYILGAIPFFLIFLILISSFFISRYREQHRLSREELLLLLIDKGESKKLEFKSSLRWDYRESCLNKKMEEVILKSIAAFANGSGGDLLIGVDDDGTPLGLDLDYATLKHPDRDSFELHLRNLASAMYGTFVSRNVDVNFIRIKEKDICQVTVRPASLPLFTAMTGKSGGKSEHFYIRDGNMSRRIESLKDITAYCRKRFK